MAHGLSSCGPWAPEWGLSRAVCRLRCSAARGIFISQPGIEPTSPALQGGFLTTGPPEKPLFTSAGDHLKFFLSFVAIGLLHFRITSNNQDKDAEEGREFLSYGKDSKTRKTF